MGTVDCMKPMVQCALIGRMAENIDTPCSLSCEIGLEGLSLTCPRWHAVLELEACQRALKWNFNELQYALPPSVIFPCDLKSGCLWMLSLKLSAVQRAQVFNTVPDLCVIGKMGMEFFCFCYDSSNLPAGRGWWTDRYIRPFPLLAVVTPLPSSQAEYWQCDLFLSTRPSPTSRLDAAQLWGTWREDLLFTKSLYPRCL